MPFEVTKKLVAADCADAGWAASTTNAAIAGMKHTREIMLARAGIGEVALQQLDVGDLVDVVAGLVGLEILGEIRHHFRRRQRVQPGDIFVRPCGLDLAEQPLEGLVVARRDLERRSARSQSETGSGAEARLRAGTRP